MCDVRGDTPDRRRLRAGLGVLFALSAAFVPARAAGQATLPVVLLRPPVQDAERSDAFNRVSAELHIHGFETLSFERELGGDVPAQLGELAHAYGALAVLALSRNDPGLALAIAVVDPKSGATDVQRLSFEGSDAASLIAVRAVDLLRARLQEFPELRAAVPPESAPAVAPPAPAPEPEPEPQPSAAPQEPTAAEAPRVWSVSAEGSVLWAGSDFGVGYAPALSVSHRPLQWFQWALWLSGPTFGTSFRAETGSASVWQALGLLEGHAFFLRAGGFGLAATLGAGAFFLHAEGDVQAPLTSKQDAVWSAAFAAGLRAEQRLSRQFALGLSVRALALAPSLGVAIVDERQALQLPVFQAGLGLVVGLE